MASAERGMSGEAAPAVAEALWTDQPVTPDGRLDEPVWRSAQAYPLTFAADRAAGGRTPHEPGTVRFAWDDRYFYAAFELVDRDVVQEDDRDQQKHYATGDVVELFLKPADAPGYFEFYATPNGRRTAFFIPSRGRLPLPSCFASYGSRVAVGAAVDGTLNDWRDDDTGWTAEIAVPIAELEARTTPFSPNHEWTLLAGRYNYGRHLPAVELTAFPQLPRTDFHRHADYAHLRLLPRP